MLVMLLLMVAVIASRELSYRQALQSRKQYGGSSWASRGGGKGQATAAGVVLRSNWALAHIVYSSAEQRISSNS